MKTKLEILIVEDDEIACRELIDEIDSNPDEFYLVDYTNHSFKAFETVMTYFPDVIILDLELHRGGGDGFDLLKKIQNAGLENPPFILVTTNNISTIAHTMARSLGADFIMTKTQSDYSAKSVIEMLKATKDVILTRKAGKNPKFSAENSALTEKRIRKLVTDELLLIGINPKSVGFKYLLEAITIYVKEPIPHICDVVGEKLKKSGSSVERGIQNAINRAWNKYDIEELLKFYTAKISSDTGTPTVNEIIFFYSTKIRNCL